MADENDRLALAIRAWALFENSKDVAALSAFAEEFADTPVAELARARIRSLSREDPQTGSDRGEENVDEVRGTDPGARNTPTPSTTLQPSDNRPRGVERRPDWCPRASTGTERAICDSVRLSELDVTMSRLYAAKRRGTGPIAWEAVKLEQRDWIRSRNRCRTDVRCMERLYRARIEELRY